MLAKEAPSCSRRPNLSEIERAMLRILTDYEAAKRRIQVSEKYEAIATTCSDAVV